MKKSERPQVIANFAVTADGKITTRCNDAVGFTSAADRRRLLEIRSKGDALLIGRKTLEIDDIAMGLPVPDLQKARQHRGQSSHPLRVMVSNSGKFDPTSKVFQRKGGQRIIFSTIAMKSTLQIQLANKADVYLMEEKVDLMAMLKILGNDYHIRTLICEGGASLFRSLLDQNCVDELYITLVPRIFGGKAAPTLTGLPGAFLDPAIALDLKSMKVIGDECFLRYGVKYSP